MGTSHFRPVRALSSVVTSLVAGALLATLAIAGPVTAVDYPSWDDVEAARGNQAATEAQIAQIETLLTQLEAESETLGRAAQVKTEEYNAAVADLDAASAKAQKLADQAQDAADRASLSSRRAGALIAQIARTGGGDVSIGILLSPKASDLLNTLGTMTKLTEQSTLIYRQAIQDQNLARSLTDQAKVAESQRKAIAAAAQDALATAKAAADAAQAKVAEQQAASDTMYAQLATLKGTTAQVEADYQAGLTAAQEAAAANPPPAPDPGSAPNSPPPAPSGSAVQTALNFAYAQLGKMYQFAGSGPDVWDCSGLTKASYAAAGYYIGAHLVSSQYYTMGAQGRLVSIYDMVPGDLIFYADGGNPDWGFYHVAMYVGGGQMIEAPREGVPVRITAVRYYDIVSYAGRPTP